MPIAAPLRARPASSAAAVNESPFHAIESAPATTSARITSATAGRRQRAPSSAAIATAIAKPICRSGPMRERTASDQRPAPMRSTVAPTWTAPSTAAAWPAEKPRSSCRNSTTKLTAAGPARPGRARSDAQSDPEPAVAQRPRRPPSSSSSALSTSALADDDRADERPPSDAEPPRNRKAASYAEVRQDDGADQPAERDRGLPDPEREAALLRLEPVHDRPSARRVDARAGGAGEAEQQRERPSTVDACPAATSTAAARPEPGAEHEPLAEPVGEQPPERASVSRPSRPTRLASTIPISPSESPSSSRIAGAMTGRPIPNAQKLVCAQRARGEHRPAVARAGRALEPERVERLARSWRRARVFVSR